MKLAHQVQLTAKESNSAFRDRVVIVQELDRMEWDGEGVFKRALPSTATKLIYLLQCICTSSLYRNSKDQASAFWMCIVGPNIY